MLIKPFSAGAPPRTPLGELTTLSQGRMGRDYQAPFAPKTSGDENGER